MSDTLMNAIKVAQDARKAFKKQRAKVYGKDGSFNGVFVPKMNRLFESWKKAEKAAIKEMYKEVL